MAKSLTTTSHALLGLLSIRAWTTYELAQQVERSLGWFWPRTRRKIYDEAKRLVEAGLATDRTEMTGRRASTVYEITDKGRETLRSWLGTESGPTKFESEAMVRVFFADGGSVDQLRQTLAALATESDDRVAVLREMAEALGADGYAFATRRPVNALMLRFLIDHHDHIARWARWADGVVESWPSTDDPGDWDWRSAVSPDAS